MKRVAVKPKPKRRPTPAGLCPELHCPQIDAGGCGAGDCLCPPCGPECDLCAARRRKLDALLARGLPRRVRPPAPARLFDPDHEPQE